MANKTVRNERRKLTTSWLNGMAVAAVSIGVFSPAAAYVYGIRALDVSIAALVLVPPVWGLTAVLLHLGALRLLGGLEE